MYKILVGNIIRFIRIFIFFIFNSSQILYYFFFYGLFRRHQIVNRKKNLGFRQQMSVHAIHPTRPPPSLERHRDQNEEIGKGRTEGYFTARTAIVVSPRSGDFSRRARPRRNLSTTDCCIIRTAFAVGSCFRPTSKSHYPFASSYVPQNDNRNNENRSRHFRFQFSRGSSLYNNGEQAVRAGGGEEFSRLDTTRTGEIPLRRPDWF